MQLLQKAPPTSSVAEWEAWNTIVDCLPETSVWPGHWCLAMVPGNTLDGAEVPFVTDEGSCWLALRLIPKWFWKGPPRDFLLASLYRTGFRFGTPVIGNHVCSYDVSRYPEDKPEDPDVLPTRLTQILRVINTMAWGLLGSGMVSRAGQAELRAKYLQFLEAKEVDPLPPRSKFQNWLARERSQGRKPTREDRLRHILTFGGEEAVDESVLAEPPRWLPEPWLAFPVNRFNHLWSYVTYTSDRFLVVPRWLQNLYGASFREGGNLAYPVVPVIAPFSGTFLGVQAHHPSDQVLTALRCKLADGSPRNLWVSTTARLVIAEGEVFKVGSCIGYERFERLSLKMAPSRRYQELRMVYGAGMAERLIRCWFERQSRELVHGFDHFPYCLVATAAREAVPSQLLWRIAPTASEFWDEDSESLVFPARRESMIGRLHGVFRYGGNELPFDVSPADNRWLSAPCRWYGAPAKRAR